MKTTQSKRRARNRNRRRDDIVDALQQADTDKAVIAGVAKAVWSDRADGDCPAAAIPTPTDLAYWLEGNTATGPAVQQTNIMSTHLLQKSQPEIIKAWLTGATTHAAGEVISWPPAGEPEPALYLTYTERAGKHLLVTALPLVELNARWRDDDGDDGHPLKPLVVAWQEANPPTVKPKQRNDSIFPAVLVQAGAHDRRAGKLFSLAHYESEQAIIPGFADGIDAHPPALPLDFYYAGGKPGEQRGYAAPVALRLWLEVIFASHLQHGGQRQRMEIDKRDLLRMLYPNGYRHGNVLPLVQQACRDLHNMFIPIKSETGIERFNVVNVRRYPERGDTPIEVEVVLPPGSMRGPKVDRAALRQYGIESAVTHRGMLNLAFRLHNPGRTSMPVRGGAHFVDSSDPERYDRLLTTDGNPVNNEAARDLVRIFYPGDKSNGGLFRKNLHRAIQSLHRIVDDGHVCIVDGRVMKATPQRKTQP